MLLLQGMLFEVLGLPLNWCRTGPFCALNAVFRNQCLNTLSTCSWVETCHVFPYKIQLMYVSVSADVQSHFLPSTCFSSGRYNSLSFKCSLNIGNVVWFCLSCLFYVCIWECPRRQLNTKHLHVKQHRWKILFEKCILRARENKEIGALSWCSSVAQK